MTIDLFEQTKHAAICLTRIASVSPGVAERAAAAEVIRLVQESGGQYDEIGLHDLPGDDHGRANAYALLRGRTNRTLILLGHIDTVDTGDYGDLSAFACDPPALAERMPVPDGWLAGRGLADMKSGVAAAISVTAHLASRPVEERPISVLLLATPDEENESAGILAALDLLQRLRAAHSLEFIGVINTDYTTALYPGDPHRYVYRGTVGKLLPSFFVVGLPSHAGAPFEGLDANVLSAELIRDLSLAPELVDTTGNRTTSPPVVLHATDLKTRYNTQIPYQAYFYLNVLTLTCSPAQLLNQIAKIVQPAVDRVLLRTAERETSWSNRPVSTRTGRVMRYAELLSAAEEKVGTGAVRAKLTQEWLSHHNTWDKREQSVQLVRRLWNLAGLEGPGVVLYYSPPYYPHVPPSPGPLTEAVDAVVAAHPELNVLAEDFFPLLCDLSYVGSDPATDPSDLIANMPAWRDEPGGYHLPLERIRSLNLPSVNIGPYGEGAHTPQERVLMSYSFRTVPQLILETMEKLAELSAHTSDAGE